MFKKIIIAACMTSLFTTYAMAGLNLKNRTAAKEHDAEIKKDEEALNRNCSANIQIKIDWPTFKNEDMHEHRFMGSVVNEFLRPITSLCSNDEGKKAIQTSINNIIIMNGIGSNEVKVNLNKGVLTYKMDPSINTNTIYKVVRNYLEENL